MGDDSLDFLIDRLLHAASHGNSQAFLRDYFRQEIARYMDPRRTAHPRDLPPTVHILREGFPLCGFSLSVPRDWPSGHRWVRLEERQEATCPDCLEQAALNEADRLRGALETAERLLTAGPSAVARVIGDALRTSAIGPRKGNG